MAHRQDRGHGEKLGGMSEQSAPTVHDRPVGIEVESNDATRGETDSMGRIEVPADRYWGAQTQRSLVHFAIGEDRMPVAVARAFGYVKKAAAIVNGRSGRLPQWKADLIARVCDEIIAGDLDEHFPALRVADRLGHSIEHERQRGHQQPLHPAGRRRPR